MNKIFLSVPYENKNKAKKYGAYFCSKSKLWYIPENIDEDKKDILTSLFDKALDKEIYLNVKYDDKDIAKSHGCKWDKINRLWYIPRNCTKSNYEYLINKFEILNYNIDVKKNETN